MGHKIHLAASYAEKGPLCDHGYGVGWMFSLLCATLAVRANALPPATAAAAIFEAELSARRAIPICGAFERLISVLFRVAARLAFATARQRASPSVCRNSDYDGVG